MIVCVVDRLRARPARCSRDRSGSRRAAGTRASSAVGNRIVAAAETLRPSPRASAAICVDVVLGRRAACGAAARRREQRSAASRTSRATPADPARSSHPASLTQKIYAPRATASSASRRRSATVLTGVTFNSRRSAASMRAQRVALGHRRERLARRRLDAHRRVVDEDARGVHVQRRARRAVASAAACARSTALSAL